MANATPTPTVSSTLFTDAEQYALNRYLAGQKVFWDVVLAGRQQLLEGDAPTKELVTFLDPFATHNGRPVDAPALRIGFIQEQLHRLVDAAAKAALEAVKAQPIRPPEPERPVHVRLNQQFAEYLSKHLR